MNRPKSLRVPLFTQPYGVGWCMPAAVRMVMAYHGDLVPLEQIAADMGVAKRGGIDEMHAAMYLLRRGYQVRICGWNTEYPASFSRIRRPLTDEAFLHWASRLVVWPSMFRKACRDFAREFVELGGIVEPRPVGLQDIRDAIDRNEPPVVFVSVTTLWHLESDRFSHAVVPISVGDSSITLNDPAPNYGRSRYDLDTFLHAFYRAEGGAMFIRPRP